MKRASLQFRVSGDGAGVGVPSTPSRSASGPSLEWSYRGGGRRQGAGAPEAARQRQLGWRPIAALLHRWVGLFIAAFLAVAGTTGTIIAFYKDLDAVLNPDLYHVAPPTTGARLLDPLVLHERVQQQLPEGLALTPVVLELREQKSVSYWIDDRETFVDPYTGHILGSRSLGDLSEGRRGVLPFLYRLHFSLGLGDVGVWLFGFASLLWSLDCFVGAYLTFPAKGPIAAARAPWLQRWAPCWLIKGNQLFSVAFTWHRASGLWVWGALLVFAWSAVAMNLPQVYDRVMSKLLPPAATTELPLLDSPRTEPRLDLRKALSRGRQLSRELARERGFALLGERQLEYDAERGSYLYRVESTLDIDARLANTTIAFDSDDGHLLSFSSPTTQGARSTIDNWLLALHFGAVREGGVPYRIFVALMGVLVTVLSVTGVWIWWRKRSKRLRAKSGAVAGRARTEKGDLAEQALV